MLLISISLFPRRMRRKSVMIQAYKVVYMSEMDSTYVHFFNCMMDILSTI